MVLAVRRARTALRCVPKLGCLEKSVAGGPWKSLIEVEDAGRLLMHGIDTVDEGSLEQPEANAGAEDN